MHPSTTPPPANQTRRQLAPAQRECLQRAIDVFSIVHTNQEPERIGPYGTVFFDDGSDFSFELSECMNIHCILSDLRRRLYPQNPPRSLVIFLPGFLDSQASTANCTVYVEVRGYFPGLLLTTTMQKIQRIGTRETGSVEFHVAPDSLRLPGDLLERIVAANNQGKDLASPIVGQAEVPIILSGIDCACLTGTMN